jgi:serine/threonine protein kinase
MSPRTDIPHHRLSASLLPPEVEPEERDFMRLLEKALSPSYTLVKRLGSGGMGTVYLARDPVLKRLVAVKVMAPSLAADADARARFEREAQSVASISHPNVVAVFSVGALENGVPFLVMQYIEGRTMAERLTEDGPLEARAAKRVLGEVASALATAHRKGIIHRDIKPANILLDDDTGRAMVTDFGIAAILERDDPRDAVQITHTGMAVGTPAYMSPEQLLAEPVTDRSDIYSLGLLGYELFIADSPYLINSPREVMAAHLRDKPRKLSTMRADVEPELERLLESCLAKDPLKRPMAAEVEKRLAHGASVLLEWPPPGLERAASRLRLVLRILLLGSLGFAIPVVLLSVFDRESFVRQSLPPTLVLLGLTIVGYITFVAGLEGARRIILDARKAIAWGYGWGTVIEAMADTRGDTGALMAGGREYAELTPETRNAMRRNRLIAAACRVAAVFAPVLGYLAGLLFFAGSTNGPAIVLWSSLLLSFTLIGAARAAVWHEDRAMAPSRQRIRTAATRAEGFQKIAEAWTATFEQVRIGQSLGPGAAKGRRAFSIGAASTAVVAAAAGALVIMVLVLTSIMGIAAEVAVPKFGATRVKIGKVQRLAAYRVVPDSTITALRAGQALHAIVRNGPGGVLNEFEKPPVISIPPQPSSARVGNDPFEKDGGWTRAAFRKARLGFSVVERDFLRAIADNSALEEFRLLARAPALDFTAAYWDLGGADGPSAWYQLPLPRLEFLRTAVNANAAQAALDFTAGRTPEAERRLKENISAGFLMMQHGRIPLLNLVGANMVAGARTSLAALYEVTGRTREAQAMSAEEDPEITLVDDAGRGTLDEVTRMLGRVILDEREALGLRWEMLLGTYVWIGCTDLHQVLFGLDSLNIATLASARESLVRTQSDSLLFELVQRARERPSSAIPPGASMWAAHRPVARIASALTGNRQLEGCVALLGLQ